MLTFVTVTVDYSLIALYFNIMFIHLSTEFSISNLANFARKLRSFAFENSAKIAKRTVYCQKSNDKRRFVRLFSLSVSSGRKQARRFRAIFCDAVLLRR